MAYKKDTLFQYFHTLVVKFSVFLPDHEKFTQILAIHTESKECTHSHSGCIFNIKLI